MIGCAVRRAFIVELASFLTRQNDHNSTMNEPGRVTRTRDWDRTVLRPRGHPGVTTYNVDP